MIQNTPAAHSRAPVSSPACGDGTTAVVRSYQRPTIVKLLGGFRVKVEVLEQLGGPVLLVPLAEAAFPPQVAPRVLQLEEPHALGIQTGWKSEAHEWQRSTDDWLALTKARQG